MQVENNRSKFEQSAHVVAAFEERREALRAERAASTEALPGLEQKKKVIFEASIPRSQLAIDEFVRLG